MTEETNKPEATTETTNKPEATADEETPVTESEQVKLSICDNPPSFLLYYAIINLFGRI